MLLTLRDTSESRSVKNELEYLKTKLDNIYSFSNLLFFRFSLQKKIALIDFNSSFITQFGYKNELELKNTSLRDILSNQSDLRIIIKELRENKIIKNKSIKFKRKDGASFDALLSMIFVFDSNNHAHFCDGIIELVTNKITDSKCVESNNILSSAIARSLQYADDLKSKIISCAYTTPLIDVVELMNIHKSDCILLMNNQDCIGILTSKDIVSRYFHTKLEVTVPAFQIMTSPVFFY